MTNNLHYHVETGIVPLKQPAFGETGLYAPEILQGRLFPQAAENEAEQQLYALLDAAKIPFLQDRLEQSGLEHKCLYEWQDFDDETGDVAPWLVKMEPESEMLRQFFSFDADDDNPYHMLVQAGGILLRSVATLDEVRAHLRHYTVLEDEDGVRLVFRLQEPGYLDAVLAVSTADEVATFFTKVDEVTYLLPSLEDEKWDAISLRSALTGDHPTKRPVLDGTRRANLRHMHNMIRARALAVETGTDLADRTARADTYYRVYMTGYDNEPTVIKTHDLLKAVPEGALAPYWDAVHSGDHSLGVLNFKLASHYGLEDMVR